MFLRNAGATHNSTRCLNSEGYQYEWSILSKSLRSEYVPYHISSRFSETHPTVRCTRPQSTVMMLTVAVAKCENSKHFLSQEFLHLNCIKQHASCETHHKTCCHDLKHGYRTRSAFACFLVFRSEIQVVT